MVLTQKETMLIKDLKSYETLCIEKYTKASQTACDLNLKALFDQIKIKEQQHLDTLEQIETSVVPKLNTAAGSSKSQNFGENIQPVYASGCSDANKLNDQFLCQDLLSEEKHVSGVYDICVFEFKNADIRNILNHIQKEEQEHGLMIYNYMAQNGMYDA